jgi:hypothetical protein
MFPRGVEGMGPDCVTWGRAYLTTILMCQEHQKAWALNLNGFDVEEAKILRLSGKPQNAPEGKT